METEKANKHHSIIAMCSRPSIFSTEKRNTVVALTDYEGNSLFKGKNEDTSSPTTGQVKWWLSDL